MLKSLQLDGFKSFADKTRLEFPAGVTVVVGPNGSGKSNVVDAIKWVLGSQSPRGLRGQEMTDVIFNGSATRRPLNAAEVTLAFENPADADADADGEPPRRRFPINEDELRLTRRVYRSGESEYLVNGRPSRLRDFRELLAGTGVGPDSYSIIEQGRVDAALRASPTERRALFEEAAGISRFRLKRREAAKRLERVEQNLLRLRDIVDEVEGRLKRVRAQASKASRHRDQTRRLKEVRTRLALADWRSLAAEQRRLDEQAGLLASNLETARRQVAERESLLDDADTASGPAAERRAAEAELASIRERMSRDASIVENESRREEDLCRELRRCRTALLEAELEARRPAPEPSEPDALAAAEAAITELSALLDAAHERVQSMATTLETKRADRDAAKVASDRAAAEQGDLTGLRQRLAERIRSTRRSLAEARESASAAAGTESTASDQLAEAEARLRTHADRLDAFQRQQERATAERDGLRRTLSDQQRELAENRGRLAADGHRLDALAVEERRLEKLNEDVRRLVADAPTRPPEVFGLVADVLHVDVDLAAMIEAALGDRTSHVVVDASEPLLEALGRHRDGLSGRVGFQRLDDASAESALDRVDLADEAGVMGRADEFVESEPRFEPLLGRLLGRTWFVDTLATATRLSRSVGRGLTFVTHAGEIVAADGSVVVGPVEDLDSALTHRREAQRLRTEVAEITAAVAAQETEAETLTGRLGEAELVVKRLREAIVAEQAAATAASRDVATLKERRRHAGESRREQTEAIEQHQEAETTLREEDAAAAIEHAKAVEEAGRLATEYDKLAAAVVEDESTLVGERTRCDELTAAIAVHRGVVASLRVETPAAQPASDGAERLDTAIEELRAASARLCDGSLLRLNAASRLATDAVHRDASERVRRDSHRRGAAQQQRRRAATAALRDLRAEAEELLSRKAQTDLRLQQIVGERRALAERMRDDYGIDLAKAAAGAGEPEDEAIDREALRLEADALRRQVNSSGPVNLESIEELDDLESRFEQLSSQYDDLAKAKAALTRLTSRINADSRGLYLSSFETVRGHFQELFARVFGGGEADLVLVGDDTDDPLERGVDIVARPPGKELRSLSLLSGGEKTLTCVALLLAMFRSKPSPFCVLDEVDAALDESNIGRFTAVLGEFLASTQFIVITHSKRTMTGADTLYGVTMQESGVSKQVSVRFEDVSEDGQIRVRRPNTPNDLRRAA